jgi:hypothetical protein
VRVRELIPELLDHGLDSEVYIGKGVGPLEQVTSKVSTEPLTTFPLSIVVFCDRCGVEVEHDYVVHDLMTREQRLAVAREHMARNEGWSCTADGDFCPKHKPEPAGTEAGR